MRTELTLVPTEVGHFLVKEAVCLIDEDQEKWLEDDDAMFGHVKTGGDYTAEEEDRGWRRILVKLFNEDQHAKSYKLTLSDEMFKDSIQVRFKDISSLSREITAPLELVGWEFCKSITHELKVIDGDHRDPVLYMHLMSNDD